MARLMRTTVPVIATIFLAACRLAEMNSVSMPHRVEYEGAAYRSLGQGELRSTLIGSTVQSQEVTTSGDNKYRYDPNGHVWSRGEWGIPLVGRYWFDGDVVCHRFYASEWCVVIYEGQNDQFIRRVVRSHARYNDGYERIAISRGVTPFPST